jgi:hypothetical protein
MKFSYNYGHLILRSNILRLEVMIHIYVDVNIREDGIMTITPSLSIHDQTKNRVIKLIRPLISDDLMPDDLYAVVADALRENWGEIATVASHRIMLWRSLRSCSTIGETRRDGVLRGPMKVLGSLWFRAEHVHHLSKFLAVEIDGTLHSLLSVKEVRYSWSKNLFR